MQGSSKLSNILGLTHNLSKYHDCTQHMQVDGINASVAISHRYYLHQCNEDVMHFRTHCSNATAPS